MIRNKDELLKSASGDPRDAASYKDSRNPRRPGFRHAPHGVGDDWGKRNAQENGHC